MSLVTPSLEVLQRDVMAEDPVAVLLGAALPNEKTSVAYGMFCNYITTSLLDGVFDRLRPGVLMHLGRSARTVLQLGVGEDSEEIAIMAFAAAVDDIGKSDKTVAGLIAFGGRLMQPQSQTVARHTNIGAQILKNTGQQGDHMEAGQLSARYHHTAQATLPDWVADYNVHGRPFGTDILPIVQIADIVDAMTDITRPYILAGLSGESSRNLGLKVVDSEILILPETILRTVERVIGLDRYRTLRGYRLVDLVDAAIERYSIEVPQGMETVSSNGAYILASQEYSAA